MKDPRPDHEDNVRRLGTVENQVAGWSGYVQENQYRPGRGKLNTISVSGYFCSTDDGDLREPVRRITFFQSDLSNDFI